MRPPGDSAPGPPATLLPKEAVFTTESGEPPPVAAAAGDKVTAEPAAGEERIHLLFAQLEQVATARVIETVGVVLLCSRSAARLPPPHACTAIALQSAFPPAAAAAVGGGRLQGLTSRGQADSGAGCAT